MWHFSKMLYLYGIPPILKKKFAESIFIIMHVKNNVDNNFIG